MVNSKLPMPTLGKIWDLADMDKDGMLDRHEFTVVSPQKLTQIQCYIVGSYEQSC
jgi:epidermal growth factor receptor substrate 15